MINGVTAIVPAIVVPYLGTLGAAVERAAVRLPSGLRIAVDPDTGMVVPFRRSLSLPSGALEALAAIAPSTRTDPRLTVTQPLPVDVVCTTGMEDKPVIPI